MAWLLGTLLIFLFLPVAIGFAQGLVEALRRPRPLRLVIFCDDD
jgi:hypothetical protein